MKTFLPLVLAVTLFAMGAFTLGLGQDDSKPLMVIPYAPPESHYAPDLENIVQEVLQENPQAGLEIQVIVPVKGPWRMDKKTKRRAAELAQDITKRLTTMGIDPKRLSTHYQNNTDSPDIVIEILLRSP